jgi:hypothetical protein
MLRTRTPAVVLLLVLLLAACSGDDTAADSATAPAAAPDQAGEDSAVDTDGPAGFAGGGPTEAAAAAAAEAGDAGVPQPAMPTSSRSVERLIKQGTMTIEVAEGAFDRGFAAVVAEAQRLGGSVVSSTSTSTEDAGTSGSITVRVPVDRYEDLLLGVGGVGEVRRRDITTQDVTAEFTDLGSRLRHARAQEAFYLGLLDQAEGVQDAIAVQQQLDGLQSSIEQMQGRLDVLADRTSFSTLTVELVEPGSVPILAEPGGPSLAGYVATAQDAFITVVGSTLVVGVALTPLLIPALLVALLWKAVARRGHPATLGSES